jgi:hypothetical protein
MTLTASIVSNAALTWFGALGYVVGHGPHLAPGEAAAESKNLPFFFFGSEFTLPR